MFHSLKLLYMDFGIKLLFGHMFVFLKKKRCQKEALMRKISGMTDLELSVYHSVLFDALEDRYSVSKVREYELVSAEIRRRELNREAV